MRRKILLTVSAFVAFAILSVPTDAQNRRRQAQPQDRPLVLRVTPRSFLDPGKVVPVGSINPGYTGYGQTQSYLLSPPYAPNGERFGVGVLPDPITNGPFVGSRNPFGPVDFVAPPGLAR
jgi:hypothetical protein